MPLTVVDQFCVPATSVTELPTTGATACKPLTCCCDGLGIGDLEVRRAGAVASRPKALARLTISRLLPRLEIWSATICVAPLPRVTMVITARDADDDAEHGQERAHQVAPDFAQGEQQGVPGA